MVHTRREGDREGDREQMQEKEGAEVAGDWHVT